MGMQLARSQIDPTKFWEDGEFMAWQFASKVSEVYEIATTVEDDKMYWHNGRTWTRFGEQTLRGEIRGLLQDTAFRELVNEVVRNVKHQTRTRRVDMFDLDPEKLVVKNGVIDLISGEYQPLEQVERPGTRTWLDVEYDPEMVPYNFQDFLFDVLHPDDVSIMWELIGYCLYRGYPFQKAALFLGGGSNGKSTLLNAIQEFLGMGDEKIVDNVSNAELQTLADDRFATADLEDKLANIAADLSSHELEHTGTFKALTGEDRVRVQRKHETPFQLVNHATLIFSANEPPRAEDETYAYERRWLYFDFPHTFGKESEDDADKEAIPQRDLLDQFRDEHPGILNMAVDHFGDLWARGGFEETVYQREHEDAHERATNPAHTFAQDAIDAAEGAVLRHKDAASAFEEWCDRNNQTFQGRQALERAVRSAHAPDEGMDPDDGRYKVWFDVELVEGPGSGEGDQDVTGY